MAGIGLHIVLHFLMSTLASTHLVQAIKSEEVEALNEDFIEGPHW
jgi:hypothetical protein